MLVTLLKNKCEVIGLNLPPPVPTVVFLFNLILFFCGQHKVKLQHAGLYFRE
jgi:hypothetical protein